MFAKQAPVVISKAVLPYQAPVQAVIAALAHALLRLKLAAQPGEAVKASSAVIFKAVLTCQALAVLVIAVQDRAQSRRPLARQ